MRFLCPALTAFVAFHALFPALAADLPTAITNDTAAFSHDMFKIFKSETEGEFNDITELFEAPQHWRYYSRDGGTLVAISVSQDLVATEQSAAKKSLADIAGRLIRQGGGETEVTVVFIEPFDQEVTAPPPVRRPLQFVPIPTPPCGCR